MSLSKRVLSHMQPASARYLAVFWDCSYNRVSWTAGENGPNVGQMQDSSEIKLPLLGTWLNGDTVVVMFVWNCVLKKLDFVVLIWKLIDATLYYRDVWCMLKSSAIWHSLVRWHTYFGFSIMTHLYTTC
jgi:hypothetical protein